MPRVSEFDKDALTRTLARQHDIIGRRQAITCGMTAKAIEHRLRPDGPWQVVLPGVYCAGAAAR
jgi:hypothetical protein